MRHRSKAENYDELKTSKRLAEELKKVDTSHMSEEDMFKYLSSYVHDTALIEEAIVLWSIAAITV